MACIFLLLLFATFHLLQHPTPNLAMRTKADELLSIRCARPEPSLDEAPSLREGHESPGRYFHGLARLKRCGATSRAKLDTMWRKGRVSTLYGLLRFSDILGYFDLKRKLMGRLLLRFWKILVACVFVLLLLAILGLFPTPNVTITIEAKARNSIRKARIRGEFRGY